MSKGFGPSGYRECHGDYRAESDLEEPHLPLYRFQQSLPRLPVPKLEDTIELYLQTVQPLITSTEFEKTKQLAKDFLDETKGGLGKVLQQRLLDRARERQDTSYLAEWWNTWGYLQVRDPVVFNVSYFFHFADSIHPQQRTNIGRAAALLRGSILFRNQVASGQMEPEQLGAKKTPICSTAYKYMFNSCRIPRRNQDTVRIFDPQRFNHVVVMRHNKFFSLDLVDPNGKILSFEQICHQLGRIIECAGSKESAIGILSAEDRDTWADAREELIRNGNEASLFEIESAMLILNLDDYVPVSRKEVARGLWHGDGKNRFFDKTIQLVVFENGKAGLLGEHSMLDGMPMARYADFLVTGLQKNKIDLDRGYLTTAELNSLAHPHQISFHFSRSTLTSILAAEKIFAKTVSEHEVHVQVFDGYGKNRIKGFKCSPDAFVQIAIQLAQKKLFGFDVATYEASQTRPYLHGRTETTRSCSIQSAAFTSFMIENPIVSQKKEEKKRLLLAAIQSHVKYMQRAAKSCGVDRHLLGLRMLVQPHEKVPFFEDEAMQKSRYWRISTSHLTNELFDGWGWGEVVPEGYGIAYSIKNHSIQFNIAVKKPFTRGNEATKTTWSLLPGEQEFQWGERLGHLLQESLLEMAQLLITSQEDKKQEQPVSKL